MPKFSYDNSWDPKKEDRGNYWPPLKIECENCLEGDESALLLLETAQWGFYYCYRCRGWYRRHYFVRHLIEPIKDKTTLKSLNWFYASEREMMEANFEISDNVKNFLYKVKDWFSLF